MQKPKVLPKISEDGSEVVESGSQLSSGSDFEESEKVRGVPLQEWSPVAEEMIVIKDILSGMELVDDKLFEIEQDALCET